MELQINKTSINQDSQRQDDDYDIIKKIENIKILQDNRKTVD